MTNGMELTRRKILAGIGGVGAAGAATGMGTSALFSDEEEFEDNQIVAGELDLKVDWQQTYDGPEDDSTSAYQNAYGSAGRPWVNAHPDEGEGNEPNGIQSLDSSQYGSVPDDGVVTYEDNGANIQEYLTCETLDHDYNFGPNDSLIELEDVKPGDSGEVTFSFHLCDNPGYVWFCAELVEANENGVNDPESDSTDTGPENETVTELNPGNPGQDDVELLDEMLVHAWYDLDCDNEFGSNEDILAGGQTSSLRSFLNDFPRLTQHCKLLNPAVYNGGTGVDCTPIADIEFTANGLVPTDGTVIRRDTYDGEFETDEFEVFVNFEDPSEGNNIVVRFYEFEEIDIAGNNPNTENVITGQNSGGADLSDIEEFDWERVPPGDTVTANVPGASGDYSSDDFGFCESTLTNNLGTSNTADLVGQGCSQGEDDITISGQSPLARLELSYCVGGGTDDCFEAGSTFCVGFEWEVPETVENEIQSDSVTLDLGFYTEQCRNNDSPGQTLI